MDNKWKVQLIALRIRFLSPIQNCTPPTSSTSIKLFILLITGIRLNALVVLFSINAVDRKKTILTRFQSGHLRTLTFKDGNKVLPTCVRCSA
ncbi:hypothetical protein TNCV_209881 [Trichonephila clavipes]|uniref:Uncharacterized protein n=1 Tax=Trichonephila clavipes TaxID=2585209 RepID=A0A8X6SY80_TRICX|nr:hypothetical protein TNCV_209881 [Trichonephila clavipes]